MILPLLFYRQGYSLSVALRGLYVSCHVFSGRALKALNKRSPQDPMLIIGANSLQ